MTYKSALAHEARIGIVTRIRSHADLGSAGRRASFMGSRVIGLIEKAPSLRDYKQLWVGQLAAFRLEC